MTNGSATHPVLLGVSSSEWCSHPLWGCRDLLAGDKRRTEVRLKAFQQRVDEAEGTKRM